MGAFSSQLFHLVNGFDFTDQSWMERLCWFEEAWIGGVCRAQKNGTTPVLDKKFWEIFRNIAKPGLFSFPFLVHI